MSFRAKAKKNFFQSTVNAFRCFTSVTFSLLGKRKNEIWYAKSKEKRKSGERVACDFFRFCQSFPSPFFLFPFLFLSLSLRLCFQLFKIYHSAFASKKVAQTSKQRLNQPCRKLSDASCKKRKKVKIQSKIVIRKLRCSSLTELTLLLPIYLKAVAQAASYLR